MKIAIFGANGFLGRALTRYFTAQGYLVLAIARRRTGCLAEAEFLCWDGETLAENWTQALEGVDAVVNLAGRTVNCRYNDEHKQEIMQSRVRTTQLIGQAMRSLKIPPKVWINSSTATIYKHRERKGQNTPHTEVSGETGTDFSMGVAKAWEKAFFEDETPVRKVAMRVAIVLGAEKGTVFDVLSKITRLGLGGPMGNGHQMFSWTHEEDFCRGVEFLIQQLPLDGVVNLVAPNAETNRELMRGLRQVWNVPVGLPAKKWMLEIGTFVMRSETELVLKSRWVYPQRLEEAGFTFRWERLQEALVDLRGKRGLD